MGGGDSTPPSRSRFGWLRAASDRVPTRWFAGIATGLFLVAAAFGGLATAAAPAVVALEPADEHRNAQLALTIGRAVLFDEFAHAQKLSITLNDMTLYTGSFVANGQWWTDPTPATIALEDIGAGG